MGARMALLLLALALVACVSGLEARFEQSSPSPVQRVVGLLQKMRTELDAEAAKESEMYDKMVCWCESGNKEKERAIADAGADIQRLTAEIEERAAGFGKLSASISQAKKEVAENTETLETATALREKAADQFREEEKDMVQAITNLRNAISVLSKHQKSLLQMDPSMVSGLRAVLRSSALQYEVAVVDRAEHQGSGLAGRRTSLLALGATRHAAAKDETTAALLSALDTTGDSTADLIPLSFAERMIARAAKKGGSVKAFLQLDEAGPESYSAQSGGVYGIMSQMLDGFQEQLNTLQNDDAKAQEDFKALASAKEREIDAGRQKLDEMEVEDAGNSKALSDAKEDLADTRKQRSEDVEFLRNLKLTCNDLDTQWEKRSKTRSAETKAVSEAIVILTEDDNREMLAKSVSLLQAHTASSSSSRRARAALALRAAAEDADLGDDLLDDWRGRASKSSAVLAAAGAGASPPGRARLAALAVAVQRDSFAKVKEMMDTMVEQLKKQQAEEVKFKSYCHTELRENEKTVHEKSELQQDLEAKMALLQTNLKELSDDISKSKDQIASTQLEIKSAGQTREEENAQYQATVTEQRATQGILKKAVMKLKDFYHKGIGKAAFVQKASQTPPAQFNEYKSNSGASPVIGLIEQIIEDSRALEEKSVADERAGQADYERFVKEGSTLIKDLQAAITTKTARVAAARQESTQATADRDSTASERQSLEQLAADLHAECDWVLKNFDTRQKARRHEMDAIQSAKATLSGAR